MSHPPVHLLHDHLDGALDADAAARVRAHLEQCGACRTEAEAIARTVGRVRALPRDIVPPRDLRPAIRTRAAARVPARTRRWTAGLAVAAALLLFVIPAVDRDEPRRTAEVRSATSAHAQAERRYEAAASRLEGLLAERQDALPASVRAGVDAALRDVNAALRQTRAELAARPEDVQLQLDLSEVYAQKIELLHGALELTTE